MRQPQKILISSEFKRINHLSGNPTKWSNTFKQFVGNSRRIAWVCLTILWGWRSKCYIWDKVFKNGLSEICRRQSLKKLAWSIFWMLCPIYSLCNYQKPKLLLRFQRELKSINLFKLAFGNAANIQKPYKALSNKKAKEKT